MNVIRKSGLLAAGLIFSAIFLSEPAHAGRAKDLFYQQLEDGTPSNTGMSYWIELRRGKSMKKVDSRYAFKSGDRIKIHLTSNVDGHAHVVLLQGTTGSKAVLFPVKGKDASNFIRKGRDMALPSTSFLVFDAKPGKEKLRIAISRKNLQLSFCKTILAPRLPWQILQTIQLLIPLKATIKLWWHSQKKINPKLLWWQTTIQQLVMPFLMLSQMSQTKNCPKIFSAKIQNQKNQWCTNLLAQAQSQSRM
jgi:hypothetical protein